MSDSIEDTSTSTNDSLFLSTNTDLIDNKLEQVKANDTETIDGKPSVEMRNFAGSTSSAISGRLMSEEFENISVSAIDDVDIQNKGENINGVKHESEKEIVSDSSADIGNGDQSKVENIGSKDSKVGNIGADIKVENIIKDSEMGNISKDSEMGNISKDSEIENISKEIKSGNIAGDHIRQKNGDAIRLDTGDGVDVHKDETDNVNNSGEVQLNGTKVVEETKDGTKDSSSNMLEEPVASTERRVSFSLEEYMEERENAYNMESRRASENISSDGLQRNYSFKQAAVTRFWKLFLTYIIILRMFVPNMADEGTPDHNQEKHSSGDLHSRLKTRKLLGVGETDDGDVHRSKLSQILGHSDQLYIRLPNGLRFWQIVLSSLLTIMAVWALVFPSHFFMFMYEVDGSSFTFPIRLYASALVCISIMYWSTIQASDRDLIRLVLLSSIVFFALQALVIGINMFTKPGGSSRWTFFTVVTSSVLVLIGYLFLSEVPRFGSLKRTTSSKEISDKEQ